MPNIVYKFQESKNGASDGGEDRLVETDDFIAVIDGATSKSGETFDGKTGGTLAAEAVGKAIRHLPSCIDAFNAVANLSAAVQENVINRYASQMNQSDHMGDRPNAGFVMYSSRRREIWRVGDGHFKIGRNKTNRGRKEIDATTSQLRAIFIQAMIGRGVTTPENLRQDDLGRKIIMSLLSNQPLLMNNPDSDMGYGVIDGRYVPRKFIEIYPVGNSRRIILSSDGVLGSLENSSIDSPREASYPMADRLEEQQRYYQTDPLLIDRHKSTKGLAKGQKWHDDVTIVEFSIGFTS